MKYENMRKGTFIARPNRFIAEVLIDGKTERAHVKNTGRCKELLIPGAEIYVQDFGKNNQKRKTRFSLYGVKKGDVLINMDSQAPNKVVEEGLLNKKIVLQGMENLTIIKREQTYGNSRFDFYLEDESGNAGWLEVKGVTLEEDGIAKFPDAPTERGIKHIEELIYATKEGYKSFILFVVQMKGVNCFEPNYKTHKAFGDALRKANKEGVSVIAYDCKVTEDTLNIENPVPVKLY